MKQDLIEITRSTSQGILVSISGKKYVLDPRASEKADLVFISHAHSDHLHEPSDEEKVVSSKETAELARVRGFKISESENIDGVELFDSGHILGSRCINIEDELIYTGDISTRERGFLKGCKLKHSRTLIIETTYGSPEYIFPPVSSIVKRVNSIISSCYDKGFPVILMGYPLGKAQILAYLFSSWRPLIYTETIERINFVYRKFGKRVPNPDLIMYDESELTDGPWLMIGPISSARNRKIKMLKEKYNAITIAFSGWAINREYKYKIGSDYAFPLSDHSDFKELLDIVLQVSPDYVFTTHGFAETFSRELRRLGFRSSPIQDYQSSLHDYMKED